MPRLMSCWLSATVTRLVERGGLWPCNFGSPFSLASCFDTRNPNPGRYQDLLSTAQYVGLCTKAGLVYEMDLDLQVHCN